MQRTEIKIEYGLCIILAVAVVLIPLRLLLSWCCAVVVHELGHWSVLRILRIPVVSLTLSARGVVMETGNMHSGEELLCAAAGPLCSILLSMTAGYLPFIAVCSAIQGIYNLIPMLPLDGGRIVQSLVEILIPGKGKKVAEFCSNIAKVLMLCAAILRLLSYVFNI